MSEQIFNANCGFFDSINHDRTYSADEMNRPYRRIISNGVFATPSGTPSSDLQVISASSGMNIKVKKGEGIFADKWFENPSDIIITVPNNTGIVPRRDSVIVQIDKRQSERAGNIVYRTGTPSSNPQPPDINTVTDVIEYRIANIYVASGATNINNDAIVDLRGSSECLWITSLINQVDTSQLYNQWRTAYQNYYDTETEAFNAFMEQLTEQLEVSTNMVKYESHYTTTQNGETNIPIQIATFNKSKDVLMVRINKLFASENTDYTISNDGSKIVLTKDLNAGNAVDFIVLQSVVVGDTETVLQQLSDLSDELSEVIGDVTDSGWINFTLESGTAYDNDSKPAVRKVGKRVSIRGAIKGLNTLNVPICTLPLNMRPSMNHQYLTASISNGAINAYCVLEARSTGSLYLIAKSTNITATAKLPIACEFLVE